MIIPYTLTLRPDETLYSYGARSCRVQAFILPREAMLQWLGSRSATLSPDLPTRLHALVSNWGTDAPFSNGKDCIERATIFPYHRPFMTVDQARRAEQCMLHGPGTGLKALIGRLANGFGANPPIRYCGQCFAEDAAANSPTYFRRAHQLPEVHACPFHGTVLSVIGTTSASSHKAVLWHPPEHEQGQKLELAPPRAIGYAKLSRDLLLSGLPAIPKQDLLSSYRRALEANGYLTDNGSIRLKRLTEAVRKHYRDFEGFEYANRLKSSETSPLFWLRDMLQRPLRTHHPVCHLLLIGFLFPTFAAFKKTLGATREERQRDPDAAPEERRGRALVMNDMHAAVLRTEISCRRAAAELSLSVNTVIKWRTQLGIEVHRRPKKVDSALRQSVSQALLDHVPIATIAANHQLSLPTVYRMCAAITNIHSERHSFQVAQARPRFRLNWMAAINADPGSSLNAVRARATKEFAWLYRHDRDWLRATNAHLATNRGTVQTSRRGRVDWPRRDQALAAKARSIADRLHQIARRGCSKSAVLRVLGCEAMFRFRMNKLPLLSKVLSDYSKPRSQTL